jgi:hypothetical protein
MYASSSANITKDIVALYDKTLPATGPASTGVKPGGATPMASPATPSATPATKKQP